MKKNNHSEGKVSWWNSCSFNKATSENSGVLENISIDEHFKHILKINIKYRT